MSERPNVIVIMTDQQRADLAAREGYALDTTPFIDSLASDGVDFARAYTPMPVCAPARVSLFTGRYPSATRVRTNHNVPDATYSEDFVDVVKGLGYRAGLFGKNHSHIADERWDCLRHFSHGGGRGDDRTDREKEFDAYLSGLHHRTHLEPAPFGVECQGPYRVVTKTLEWLGEIGAGAGTGTEADPFFAWVSFAEPHNPFQAAEPYYSMFPPESLPACRSGEEALGGKGFRWQWLRKAWDRGVPDFLAERDRARANYHGMLRLIDDQIRRLFEGLDARGLREKTIVVFCSDHGDFVGEYGLIRKGPDLPEVLTRVPLIVTGPGIARRDSRCEAHVGLTDIMPTLCEALGVPLPQGVQGRSLWPLLTGGTYPEDEFRSAYAEHGFGGLAYDGSESLEPAEEGAINDGCTFDCLNTWTQSGQMRMVRMGEWKLVVDSGGRGQLFNLDEDPVELNDIYDSPDALGPRARMLEELAVWMLRTQDPLPVPRRRYVMKTHPRNYWTER